MANFLDFSLHTYSINPIFQGADVCKNFYFSRVYEGQIGQEDLLMFIFYQLIDDWVNNGGFFILFLHIFPRTIKIFIYHDLQVKVEKKNMVMFLLKEDHEYFSNMS